MAAKAGVSLPVYALARYMTSEVGSGTIEEMVAVGEAAVNRARMWGYQDVTGLLLYRQPEGHPNRGRFGPIHGPGGTSSAPYGRWAATSKDPHLLALKLAEFVLSGESGNWSGADDQDGIEYFSSPSSAPKREATSSRKYWIGPRAGIDHWRTFLWRTEKSIDPDSPDGQALIARGVWATKQPRPVWDPGLPIEARIGIGIGGVIVAGVAGYFLWKKYGR